MFEGLTHLGEAAESGKTVDARVSSAMLQTIFHDKTPLHDGAVIIRDMRIWKAGCVLPSTKSQMDFGNMGTRHRAAVGVTEESDSLVIVVSEQTGTVSVAQDGLLLRGLDAETLKDVLMTYIAGKTYLRFKRANLRSDYMDLLDRASDKALKRKANATRFNEERNAVASDAPEENESLARAKKQAPTAEEGSAEESATDSSESL